jgi:hypothetical protein
MHNWSYRIRLIRINIFMGNLTAFALASQKYRPDAVRILFIAEAPPTYESKRFFYFTDVRRQDTLFLEMMKTLYPAEVGFSHNRFGSGFSSQAMRARKHELLNQFKVDGYYLIDACEQPMPRGASNTLKTSLMRKALPALKNKLARLGGPKTIGVLLIGAVTYAVCADALKADGVRIVNTEAINHPARGGQILFRSKLLRALNTLR